MARRHEPACDYSFYEHEYGGTLCVETFHEAYPAALRVVRRLTGGRGPRRGCEERRWKRAVCAAVEALAEYGEGQMGGFQVGSFRAVEYGNVGSTGSDVATEAALAELAGTGLAFSGVC